MATTESVRPRRGKKIALGVVVMLVILLALLPTIAGVFAPGIISGAASSKMAGKLTVDRVGLSWFGRQEVGKIRLIDPADPSRPVAEIDVSYDGGLAGLAAAGLGSSPQLKTVTITGTASLVRAADGKTNLERAIAPKSGAATPAAPTPTSASGKGQIPPGLKAHVIFNGDVNYSDSSGKVESVQVKGITADADRKSVV